MKKTAKELNIINKGQGYSTKFCLEKLELDFIRRSIQEQWLYRIQIEDPKLVSKIIKENISMSQYHLISMYLDHEKIWNKTSRILSSSFVDWFLKTNFIKELENEFGSFQVSDEDDLGWPNIYWRLVRPNQKKDVGPIHRDSWFWELNQTFPRPNYPFKRIKVWVPIFIELGLNGLLVEEFSQKRQDIKWVGESRHGIQKPVLLTTDEEIDAKLVMVKEGQSIVFNDNLLHGGAINRGETSRVSIEFTIMIRET